ncbi:MAG: glycolate oxidase subunit GlcE [Alphaproteobacteria bacterium]
MIDAISVRSSDEVAAAIQAANAARAPVEIVAGGTKRGFGRPVQAARTLDMSALSGITMYESDELVLSARAGTKLAEIRRALEAQNQLLAFEPPDLGPLLGAGSALQTIGGVLACNLSGSRRIKAGAARDHFLGLSAVSGRGEQFKSGGRVMKNVTGYDLPKLLAGSFGTLAVMTDVTLKVLPAPEKTRTVLAYGLRDDAAIAAMSDALNSPYDVSGAAHLPPAIAARSAVDYVRTAGKSVTALRVEGPAKSVEARCAALRGMLSSRGPTEELHRANSAALWAEVTNAGPFVGDAARHVWRVSVPPSAGARVAARVVAALRAEHYFDWGGGLIWLALPPADDAGAVVLRAALGDGGGHGTLVRAPAQVRAVVPVFQPAAPALAALSARVKAAFDPLGILNPGRMTAGG